ARSMGVADEHDVRRRFREGDLGLELDRRGPRVLSPVLAAGVQGDLPVRAHAPAVPAYDERRLDDRNDQRPELLVGEIQRLEYDRSLVFDLWVAHRGRACAAASACSWRR